MDPRERAQIETAIEQGENFALLQRSPQWIYYREWVEKAIQGYENQVHAPANRTDHVALTRALEGHEAVSSLLENMDKAITNIPKLRKQLDAIDNPE